MVLARLKHLPLANLLSPGNFGFPLTVAGLMIAAEVLDWLMPFWDLDRFGVKGWSLAHVPGIGLMPLTHGGFAHLLANLLPFVVLGTLLALRREFVRVGALGTLGTGLALWLWPFSSAVHVGASGLVLCFFGFLFLRGLRTLNWLDVGLSAAVALFYGASMAATTLNFGAGVSWQGHLFGLLVGLALAWVLPQRAKS